MAKGGLKTLTYGGWFPMGALWLSAWPAQTSQLIFWLSNSHPALPFLKWLSLWLKLAAGPALLDIFWYENGSDREAIFILLGDPWS